MCVVDSIGDSVTCGLVISGGATDRPIVWFGIVETKGLVILLGVRTLGFRALVWPLG